jgi:hypothetical protein
MRATKAQVGARVEEILRIKLDGAEIWDLREYVKEKVEAKDPLWGDSPLSDMTLYRYARLADELIAESCRGGRKRLLRRHLAQRRNLFAKAVSAGDYRTALAVAKDEAELQGLYPPKKVAPTTPDGDAEYGAGLTDAERAAALRALYARMGRRGGATPPNGEAHAGGPLLDGPGPVDASGGA